MYLEIRKADERLFSQVALTNFFIHVTIRSSHDIFNDIFNGIFCFELIL